ncbi:unnamed protein product [Macrosiphum euphorbiae]|uniref:Uncharacterized protein n=1 Tax=Macrosiphum euphorbiae TaxID=13131 RepID=A0AAV0W3P7_9HEMI|nr:unnamed protein product [Macrosiphum euphorbiae]
MKRDAPTINSQVTELLNTNDREEKKGNEGSSAKKRDIAAVDGVSSETAPKRSKRVVSKIINKSLQHRRVRKIANSRIRVPNYSPLKHYTSKLSTIPEE